MILNAYGDNGDSLDEAGEDEDSNDENNWRNEYPDSEKSSIDEGDMVRAMQRVDLGEISVCFAVFAIYVKLCRLSYNIA